MGFDLLEAMSDCTDCTGSEEIASVGLQGLKDKVKDNVEAGLSGSL